MASLGTREQKVRTASWFACLAVCFPIVNRFLSNDTLVSGVVDAALCALAHLPLCCYYIEVLTWKRDGGFSTRNYTPFTCHSLKLYVCDTSLRRTPLYFRKGKPLSHLYTTLRKNKNLDPKSFPCTKNLGNIAQQHSNALVTFMLYYMLWAKQLNLVSNLIRIFVNITSEGADVCVCACVHACVCVCVGRGRNTHINIC